jgi:hypothetical protein
MAHPLRPQEDFILVCEGESDFLFLSGIFGEFVAHQSAPVSIYIVQAGGEKNVRTLANILEPAVWVRDRDFRLSVAEAQATLREKSRKTYWPCQDVEGYLLYEDWLLNAVRSIRQAPKMATLYVPADAQEVMGTILQAARSLVVYHAGSHTCQELTHLVGPRQKYCVRVPPNGEAIDDQAWRQHLVSESARLIAEGKQLVASPGLVADNVLRRFEQHLQQYTVWAKDADAVRIHFSGKRIFQILASKWQAGITGHKYSWEKLREEVQKQATDYVRFIRGALMSDDPRLGDIGLLASKIVGRKI